MGMIYILHVIICVLLVLTILFQDGKAGGFSGVADNATSQAMFGAKGAGDFLTKVTTYLATIFMVTSLTLAVYNSPGESSIGDDFVPEQAEGKAAVEGSETETSPFDIDQKSDEADANKMGAIKVDPETGEEIMVPLSDVISSENVEVVPWEDAPQELKDAHKAERKLIEEAEKAKQEPGDKESTDKPDEETPEKQE